MKRIHIHCLAILCFSLTVGAGAAIRQHPLGDSPTYRHAYYLFLAGAPTGCEDCYVPLLITKEPLEELAKAKEKAACVLIITYERDSIWHDDGIVPVAPGDIEIASRVVHLRNRRYRYQEIDSWEVLKILQNPMGTIPIARPALPIPNSMGPSLRELISIFQEAK